MSQIFCLSGSGLAVPWQSCSASKYVASAQKSPGTCIWTRKAQVLATGAGATVEEANTIEAEAGELATIKTIDSTRYWSVVGLLMQTSLQHSLLLFGHKFETHAGMMHLPHDV